MRSSPVDDVPPEIISKILEDVIEDHPLRLPLRHSDPISILLKVSSHWRSFILGSPKFWTHIELDRPKALRIKAKHYRAGFNTCLTRASNQPLRITFKSRINFVGFDTIKDIIKPHAHQIQHLCMSLALHDVDNLLLSSISFPILTTFTILVGSGSYHMSSQNFNLSFGSCLRHFLYTCRAISSPAIPVPWNQLTNFRLDEPRNVNDYARIAPLLRNLEHHILVINRAMASALNTIPTGTIYFPDLRIFEIVITTTTILFEGFVTPNLRTLDLDIQASFCTVSQTNFVTRSNVELTSLWLRSVSKLGGAHDDLTGWLTNLPTVKKLVLYEDTHVSKEHHLGILFPDTASGGLPQLEEIHIHYEVLAPLIPEISCRLKNAKAEGSEGQNHNPHSDIHTPVLVVYAFEKDPIANSLVEELWLLGLKVVLRSEERYGRLTPLSFFTVGHRSLEEDIWVV